KPELKVGISSAPLSLNTAQGGYTPWMAHLTNQTLLTMHSDATVGPGLAASFHYIGTGNRVFEMVMRHDAKFSDGTPVNAKAVKTWLNYVSTAGGSTANEIAIKSIDTPDEWTVRINLAQPNPLMANWLANAWDWWGFVTSPKAIANPKS